MVYEHKQFPADLKSEMYAWIREHALEERKPKDTEEQFLYKARKKAIGPFKKRMWSIEADRRRAIGQLHRVWRHAAARFGGDRASRQHRRGRRHADLPALRRRAGSGNDNHALTAGLRMSW